MDFPVDIICDLEHEGEPSQPQAHGILACASRVFRQVDVTASLINK